MREAETSRTWLITGCSTGFGRALATLLLAQGDRVTLTARDPSTLADLSMRYPESAIALSLDVTRPDQIEAVTSAARERFGQIDALVNNAGYGQLAVLEDTSIEDARLMMETNFLGALAMVKAVLPEMRTRRRGQIVTIGSVAGLVGFPALTGYCASKAALTGFSEALASEVRPFGVSVTIVELGPFATAFTRSMRVTPPGSSDYDLAELSAAAGTSHWGAGDDPAEGARALLIALADPVPPLHLILGQPGLDVVALHEARRTVERAQWLEVSRLSAHARIPSSKEDWA